MLTFFLKFRIKGDETEANTFLSKSLQSAFSFYSVSLAPKNAYLYEFYQTANMRDIDEYNNVDEFKLWYGMKASRQLLTVLCNNIQSYKNLDVIKTFDCCLKRVTECFFKISN